MTFEVAKTTAPHRPNSMTHHCTAARAPQESCWQEFQPAWIHHMPSPNLSPAGKTPSSTRASVQPARLIMSCCQGLQPTTPHHPCLQELQPALDSSQKRHPSASKNSSLYRIQASSPLATFTSNIFQQHQSAPSAGWPELYPALRLMDSPQPQKPRKQH